MDVEQADSSRLQVFADFIDHTFEPAQILVRVRAGSPFGQQIRHPAMAVSRRFPRNGELHGTEYPELVMRDGVDFFPDAVQYPVWRRPPRRQDIG